VVVVFIIFTRNTGNPVKWPEVMKKNAGLSGIKPGKKTVDFWTRHVENTLPDPFYLDCNEFAGFCHDG
jgi:hypothetical protein